MSHNLGVSVALLLTVSCIQTAVVCPDCTYGKLINTPTDSPSHQWSSTSNLPTVISQGGQIDKRNYIGSDGSYFLVFEFSGSDTSGLVLLFSLPGGRGDTWIDYKEFDISVEWYPGTCIVRDPNRWLTYRYWAIVRGEK